MNALYVHDKRQVGGALPMLWALKLAIGYWLLAISKKLRATSD